MAGDLPEGHRDFLALASVASEITVWEATQVPKFLRTPQHANALAAADPTLGDDLSRQACVQATLGLQQALKRSVPVIRILFGEAALHHKIGGDATMEGQLGLLATAGGGTRKITIQLVGRTANSSGVMRLPLWMFKLADYALHAKHFRVSFVLADERGMYRKLSRGLARLLLKCPKP